MRKLFYLLTLTLVFLYGCSKEDSGIQNPNSEDLKFEKLSYDGKTSSNGRISITIEDLQAKSGSRTSSRSSLKSRLTNINSGANGYFSTNEGNTVSFSSGDGVAFGRWNMQGVLNYKGDVICATVEGNQAVVQVVITQVGEIPEGAVDIVAGYTHLFLLEDNGEGFKAPSDRYWNYSLFIPATYDFCLGLGPAEFIDIFAGFPVPAHFSNTAKKSDKIQIKN